MRKVYINYELPHMYMQSSVLRSDMMTTTGRRNVHDEEI